MSYQMFNKYFQLPKHLVLKYYFTLIYLQQFIFHYLINIYHETIIFKEEHH